MDWIIRVMLITAARAPRGAGKVNLKDFRPPQVKKYNYKPLKVTGKPKRIGDFTLAVIGTKIPNQTDGTQDIDINWIVRAWPNFNKPEKYEVSKTIWQYPEKGMSKASKSPKDIKFKRHQSGSVLPKPKEKYKFIIREDDVPSIKRYIESGGRGSTPRFK